MMIISKYASVTLVFCLIWSGATSGILMQDTTILDNTLWTFRPASGKPFSSSPVVNGNKIYLGGFDSIFYALNTSNGTVTWKIRTGGPIKSSPLVKDGAVFFYSGDGHLYKVTKESGKIEWKFQTGTGFMGDRSYDLADQIHSSPVIDGNMIFIGSSDGSLYAVDLFSGKEVWHFKTGDIIHSKPAIEGDRVYVGSFDGNVYSLRRTTGEMLWKFKTLGNRFFNKGEIVGSPVVSQGAVYVGSRDYNLYAIDALHGFCRWVKVFPGGWATSVIANDSIIYVGTSDDKAVFAIDRESGRVIWKSDVKFNIIGELSFAQNTLFAATLMGKVYCLDPKKGKAKGIIQTDGYRANRLQYFNEDDSFRSDVFKIVRTPQDALLAYVKLDGIYSSPIAAGNKLFVSTYGGVLYCFELKEGQSKTLHR